MNIKESFERVGFTPEEKLDLTARLEQAAEWEENMTNATKRKIKKISGGTIFGIAAAAVMTVGALAAVINPSLRSWFDTSTPGASSALEDGIYRLDRSETHEGWTVTLDECVGDDTSLYILVDITAPEGTVFAPQHGGSLVTMYYMDSMGMNLQEIPDEDPADNKKSFVLQNSWQYESLRGQTATIKIGPVEEHWTSEPDETGSFHAYTEALLDYEWVFEDVKLDFPDQTIRLTPNVEVPWIDGTTTVTRLEVSPLSILVELEGGSAADYLAHANGDPFAYDDADEGPDELVVGDFVMTFGTPSAAWQDKLWEMESSLALGAVLTDGTKVEAIANVGQKEGIREGVEGAETPFFSTCRRYSYSSNGPASLVDPTEVEYVTVCGVEIPLDPAASIPAGTFAEVPDGAEPPAEAAPTVGTVSAGKGLNIRSGPGTQFEIVGGLAHGAQVTILEEENGFYKISTSENQIGYVSKSYVTVN